MMKTVRFIQLGLLAATLGVALGSPTKARADVRSGKYVQITKGFGCDCGATDTSCYCLS